MEKENNSIIAQREFELFHKDTGEFIDIIFISIALPIQHEDDWTCVYIIKSNEKIINHPIYGVDSFQALMNSIGVVKNEIEGLKKKYTIKYLSGNDLWL